MRKRILGGCAPYWYGSGYYGYGDYYGLGYYGYRGITDIGVLRTILRIPRICESLATPCFYLVAGAGFEPATFGIMSATPNACNLLIINYYSDSFEEFGQKFLQCFR